MREWCPTLFRGRSSTDMPIGQSIEAPFPSNSSLYKLIIRANKHSTETFVEMSSIYGVRPKGYVTFNCRWNLSHLACLASVLLAWVSWFLCPSPGLFNDRSLTETSSSKGTPIVHSPCPPKVGHSEKQPLHFEGGEKNSWKVPSCVQWALCTRCLSLSPLSSCSQYLSVRVCWGFCSCQPSVSWGSTRWMPVRWQYRGAAIASLALSTLLGARILCPSSY